MTITVYDVIADYGLITTHIKHEKAVAHCKHIERFGLRPGEWVGISLRQVATLSNERILVDGWTAVYQFNRSSNGQRTITRMVRNLSEQEGDLYGEVRFLGRKLKVKHDPKTANRMARRYDSAADWIVMEIVAD